MAEATAKELASPVQRELFHPLLDGVPVALPATGTMDATPALLDRNAQKSAHEATSIRLA